MLTEIGKPMVNRTIRLRISDTCNFNCSYCIEHDNLKDTKFINQFDLILILENLKRIYQKDNRKQNLFIWGGEPTLNPNLIWFIKHLRTYYTFIDEIEMHSNLSGNYDLNFINVLKDAKVTVASSYHLEYKSKKVIDNFRLFRDNWLLTEINLMLHNLSDFDKCLEFKYMNKDLPLSIVPTFQLLNTNFNKVKLLLKSSRDYDDKSIPTSEGSKNYIDIYNMSTKDMVCNVPLDSFIVNTDGNVYFCQNYYLESKPAGINIFNNLSIEDIIKLTNPTKCIFNKCDCEHIILKTK